MSEWAIQVVGDDKAVDRLRSALGPDDHVRVDDAESFLVRRGWQQAPGWESVDADGRAYVKYVNGLMRLRGGSIDPLRFGGVVLLKDGGGREFYGAGTAVFRLSGTGVEGYVGSDGQPVPPPPDPLLGWLSVADAHADMQAALSVFGDVGDWSDLYKVYELVRKGLGNQDAVETVIGTPTRSNLTQTINHHRHAVGHPLPAQPVTFEDAERLVARLLEEWLAKL